MHGSESLDTQVTPRAQRLFKLLVEQYIAEGVPVASKALATRPDVTVSSATVRIRLPAASTRCWSVASSPSRRSAASSAPPSRRRGGRRLADFRTGLSLFALSPPQEPFNTPRRRTASEDCA